MKLEQICVAKTTDYFMGTGNSTYGKSLLQTRLGHNIGYRCDYHFTNSTYILSRYDVTSTDDSITESTGEVVAMFDMQNHKLQSVSESAVEEIKSVYSNNPALLLPIIKFVEAAYLYAPNQFCGPKLWGWFEKASSINRSVALNRMLTLYDQMESLEKLGESMIGMIGNEDFQINTNASERHKTLGIPKQVLDYCEELATSQYDTWESEYCIKAFQKMRNVDNNELIAIVDYFRLYDQLAKKISFHKTGHDSSFGRGSKSTLVDLFAQIKEKEPSIDLRKLLRYLLRQQLNRLHRSSFTRDCERFAVEIPSVIARIYLDYIKLEPGDLFPQHLYKSHNILSLEIKNSFSQEEKERFHEYGIQLAQKFNRTIDGFRFEVPTDYDEFFRIGKTFQNCLPSCGTSFYRGLCDIVFILRDGEDTPKYAIELNKDGLLMQAKTTKDMDISEQDVLTAIEKFEKQVFREYRKENE